MIVLDRSCSMDASPGNGETKTKWVIAEEAIGTLTTTYAGKLNFGLIMFPDETGVSCDQDGPIYVAMGAGNEQAVRDGVANTDPSGPCVTNIDTAMAQVGTDPAYSGTPDPSGRRGFAVLITDGKQSGSCGGNANDLVTIANIEALYMAGYPTYVVGFGGGVDPADLDKFAMAGGVPRVGTPLYYQADSAAELDAALDAIAGDIVGDPELGGCAGSPCPDGRCFGDDEMCIEGVCKTFLPDAGPMPDASANGGDGGDGDGDGGFGGDGNESGGCCSASNSAAHLVGTTALAVFVLALLLGLPRRQRAPVRRRRR